MKVPEVRGRISSELASGKAQLDSLLRRSDGLAVSGNMIGVGHSRFPEIARRGSVRFAEWEAARRFQSVDGLLPDPPTEVQAGTPGVSAQMDSAAVAILHKYSVERTNAVIRVSLLERRLADAQAGDKELLKSQLNQARTELGRIESLRDSEVAAHLAIVSGR